MRAEPATQAWPEFDPKQADEFWRDVRALYPLRDVVGFGADDSTLGDDVREVAAKSGVKVVPDPEPDHLVFVRSDQYNFVRKGTPAIMLQMSPAPGTPEEATA